MLPKKFFVALVLLLVAAHAPAQTVKVKKDKATIKGESMEGYSVDLDGSLADVNSALSRFLKTIGKVKQSDFFTLNEPGINGQVYTQPLYAIAKQEGQRTSAWLGFNSAVFAKEDADRLIKDLESVVKDFGIRFYHDKIQQQIDESEKARQTVEKQQQRLLNENKMLNNKLESNKKQKVNLEKAIEDNKNEYASLLKRIEDNKRAQDSVAVAAEQIKKVVDAHKEKQRKVN
jgi:hypothetical protein